MSKKTEAKIDVCQLFDRFQLIAILVAFGLLAGESNAATVTFTWVIPKKYQERVKNINIMIFWIFFKLIVEKNRLQNQTHHGKKPYVWLLNLIFTACRSDLRQNWYQAYQRFIGILKATPSDVILSIAQYWCCRNWCCCSPSSCATPWAVNIIGMTHWINHYKLCHIVCRNC